jgi:hypothetical protein
MRELSWDRLLALKSLPVELIAQTENIRLQ